MNVPGNKKAKPSPLYSDDLEKDRCYCNECGVELPRGYRETFTACDRCWDQGDRLRGEVREIAGLEGSS